MILNELKLSNFCIYRGEHEFDLAPAENRGKSKPVVLFGGMNGGGKTTILDAVQLVLYGKRAKCSKRGEKSYEDFLRSCINHDVDPQTGASIVLTFLYASEGSEHVYEVSRLITSTNLRRVCPRRPSLSGFEGPCRAEGDWNRPRDPGTEYERLR